MPSIELGSFSSALDSEHEVARHEAGEKRAEEAAGNERRLGFGVHGRGEVAERVTLLGDPAANKARRKTGTIGDGHGDVARKDGQHEAECPVTGEVEKTPPPAWSCRRSWCPNPAGRARTRAP